MLDADVRRGGGEGRPHADKSGQGGREGVKKSLFLRTSFMDDPKQKKINIQKQTKLAQFIQYYLLNGWTSHH